MLSTCLIPVTSILVDGEGVDDILPWDDRALRDHIGTIHFGRTILEHAVKMHARRFVTKSIVHMNDASIAFVDLNHRQWPRAIDSYDLPFEQAIRVYHYPCDVEPMLNGGSIAQDEPRGGRNEEKV